MAPERVLFLVGSLQPGSDGVGDYARGLAEKLEQMGISTRLCALADHGLGGNGSKREDARELRLSATLPWRQRIKFARTCIEEFAPDVVSLQFVVYAYDKRGLPVGLGRRLAAITRGWSLHLMLHETWIGFTRISTFKHKVIGWLQRQIVLDVVIRSRAKWVQTTNLVYRQMLADAGANATVLPLFSNIPVQAGERDWMTSLLLENGITPANRQNWVVVGIFGSVHPGCPLEAVVAAEARSACACGKRLALLSIGRMDIASHARLAAVPSVLGDDGLFSQLGAQPAARISAFLQAIDKGMATMQNEFLDKSGVVAAMRLHGVEILHTHSVPIPEFANITLSLPESQRHGNVSLVARQFVQLIDGKP